MPNTLIELACSFIVSLIEPTQFFMSFLSIHEAFVASNFKTSEVNAATSAVEGFPWMLGKFFTYSALLDNSFTVSMAINFELASSENIFSKLLAAPLIKSTDVDKAFVLPM